MKNYALFFCQTLSFNWPGEQLRNEESLLMGANSILATNFIKSGKCCIIFLIGLRSQDFLSRLRAQIYIDFD